VAKPAGNSSSLRTPSPTKPIRDGSCLIAEFREEDINQVITSLRKGQSLLVLGEAGSGKSVLGITVAKQMGSEFRVAIASYSGSAKQTLIAIAEALDVPIETADEKPKPLTADQLRVEIKNDMNSGRRLLIADDAHRWPASLRYWMEELLRGKGLLLLLADRPPARDVFLKMPRLELEPLSTDQIRTLMYAEATAQGMAINPSKFAELQQRVGGNPALAKRVVHEEMLGIGEEMSTDHRQYIDGTPFLIASLSAIGIVRFVGLGMGDKALYMVGGVATLAAISLRTLFSAVNRKSTRLGR
jgi:energy-coupling factor transporter ATP-binding protein EcfA2